LSRLDTTNNPENKRNNRNNSRKNNNMNMKSLVLASVVTLGLTTMVNAQSYVYMTGSTAGRAAIFATMSDTTANGVFDAGTATIIPSGATSGSSRVNFRGTIAGVDTMVKCLWSGSEAGYSDVAGVTTETFLTDDGSAVDPTPRAVDLCAADNAVGFSKLTAVQQATITANFVAVIPFKWVKEVGSAAGLVGVTDQSLRQALKANAKLALFTGNSGDTTYVYVSGRDSGSGTRVNAQGTCGYGIFAAPAMVQIDSLGSMIAVDGTRYTGDHFATGEYGYASGGTLATQMGYSLAASVDKVPLHGTGRFSVIAYLGVPDAAKAEGLGATALTYNGIPFSIGAIQEGQYNYWGNYHVAKKNSGLNAQAPAVYTKLIAASPAGVDGHADDTVLIKRSTMHATRTGPTADPVHN
jgi:hypothetical protein